MVGEDVTTGGEMDKGDGVGNEELLGSGVAQGARVQLVQRKGDEWSTQGWRHLKEGYWRMRNKKLR